MRGIGAEEAAVDEAKDDDDDGETEEDGVGLRHGELESADNLGEVGEEVHDSEEPKDTEKTEDHENRHVEPVDGDKEHEDRRERENDQDAVHPVPSIGPIATEAVDAMLDNHLDDEDERAEDIEECENMDDRVVMDVALLKEDCDGVDEYDNENEPATEE